MMLSTIIGLIVVGIIVMIVSFFYEERVQEAKIAVEEIVLAEINKYSNQTVDERMGNLPQASLEGSLSGKLIDYSKEFTKHFFDTQLEGEQATKGQLIRFKTIPRDTDYKDWNLVLYGYSKGVNTLVYDGVKLERIGTTQDENYPYLQNKDLCVLPQIDEGKDALYVLSYALDIPIEEDHRFITKDELEIAINRNKVEQIHFSLGKAQAVMKYFTADKTINGRLYESSTQEILAYYYQGTLCFFPFDADLFFDNHVQFIQETGLEITGEGYVHKNFMQQLNKYETNLQKINIKQGD